MTERPDDLTQAEMDELETLIAPLLEKVRQLLVARGAAHNPPDTEMGSLLLRYLMAMAEDPHLMLDMALSEAGTHVALMGSDQPGLAWNRGAQALARGFNQGMDEWRERQTEAIPASNLAATPAAGNA